VRTEEVPWSVAVESRRAVSYYDPHEGDKPVFERVIGAETSPETGRLVVLTDRDRTIEPANGRVLVLVETPPLKVLAALSDGTFVTLVRWLRDRNDLESIQALDAGGGRLTLNLRAAQPDHPMRVRLEHPSSPTYEIVCLDIS
jgi:hypothetical protein